MHKCRGFYPSGVGDTNIAAKVTAKHARCGGETREARVCRAHRGDASGKRLGDLVRHGAARRQVDELKRCTAGKAIQKSSKDFCHFCVPTTSSRVTPPRTMASLGDAPFTAAQAAKRRSVNPTKVTKSEEAIFTLQPGKDAFARIAAAATPFRPVIEFVEEGLAWHSTRAALSLQFVFCVAVLHPQYLLPVGLCTLGACTLANKGEGQAGRGDSKNAKDGKRVKIDAKWAQLTLESCATRLERLVSITTWEDPIVTSALIASCVALAFLCMYVRVQTLVLLLGVWLMRPPAWKVVPGPATNLMERMPDKEEAYGRLTQGGGAGKTAVA